MKIVAVTGAAGAPGARDREVLGRRLAGRRHDIAEVPTEGLALALAEPISPTKRRWKVPRRKPRRASPRERDRPLRDQFTNRPAATRALPLLRVGWRHRQPSAPRPGQSRRRHGRLCVQGRRRPPYQRVAEEHKHEGVLVNAVLPSIIDTPRQPRRHARRSVRQLGDARAAANVILFLLSPEASAVTRADPGHGRV